MLSDGIPPQRIKKNLNAAFRDRDTRDAAFQSLRFNDPLALIIDLSFLRTSNHMFVTSADIRNRAQPLERRAGRQGNDECSVDDLVQNLMSERFNPVPCYKGKTDHLEPNESQTNYIRL